MRTSPSKQLIRLVERTERIVLVLIMLAAAGTFFAQVSRAHGAWDGTPYDPEETLDPECPPDEGECRVTRPVYAGENVPAGAIPYTTGTDTWDALLIGAEGKVLKVQSGGLVWGDDNGGQAYSASEQALKLDATSHVFAIALDGSALSQSGAGLKIADAYPGQSSISTLGTITSGVWHGTPVAPLYGGTGVTTTPANGQLLIGNGTTFALANPTGSNGIAITSGAGTLDIGLSISGLSAVSSAGSGDFLPLYDGGAGQNRKISVDDFMASVLGSLRFEGTWNANTNSPSLSNGMCTSGENGSFYIVGTAGTTTLGGVSSWSVGDWVICDGTTWSKVASTNSIASVFGRTGTITAQSGDYTASQVTNVATGTIAATTVQAALNELATEKEGTIAAGLTTQYWRGDKAWATLDTLAVTENSANRYYTDARSRAALSSASVSLAYSTSTGVLAVAAGYSIPHSGNTAGEMLVWDGSEWVPADGISMGSSLLDVDGTIEAASLLVDGVATTTGLVVDGAATTTSLVVSGLTQTAGIAVSGVATTTGLVVNGTATIASTTITSLNAITANLTNASTSALSVLNGLTVGATVTSPIVNATAGLRLNGTDINTAGVLSNVGYLNQSQTFTGLQVFAGNASTSALSVTGNALLGTSGGNVGIGTTSPSAKLAIQATVGTPSLVIGSSSAPALIVDANARVGIGTNAPSNVLHVKGDVSGTVARFESTSGSLVCGISTLLGLLSCTSDETMKKDIAPLSNQDVLAQVMELRPVAYHWKNDASSDSLKYGFIAQDVEKIFPTLVTTDPETGKRTLAMGGLTPFIVQALQEQQARIDLLASAAGGLASSILSHIAFGNDTVGEAVIAAGERSVDVRFDEPYEDKPVITVTPQGETDGSYWVDLVTPEGFVIKLSDSADEAVTFSWHAFAKKGLGFPSFAQAPESVPQAPPAEETVPETPSEEVPGERVPEPVEETVEEPEEEPAPAEEVSEPVPEAPAAETI